MVDAQKGNLFGPKLFESICGCLEGAISLHLRGI